MRTFNLRAYAFNWESLYAAPREQTWLLSAAVVVFFSLVGCGGSSAPISTGGQPGAGQSATIAFVSMRALDGSDTPNANLTFNVWVVKSDGSGLTPLTRLTALGASSLNATAWSPDGSKLVFVSQRALDGSNAATTNGANNIWVMNADGSSVAPLTRLTMTSAVSEDFPVWSPDGSKLAFASPRALDGTDATNANGTNNIWVINADGSGATPLTRLTVPGSDSFAPRWSPDGTKITFSSARALDGSNLTNDCSNVWVMNANGAGATPLTKLSVPGPATGAGLWSPSGNKLAFLSSRALDGSNAMNTNGIINIWVMNPDGSGATPLTRLTASGTSADSVGWSPDGAKIAFLSERPLDGSNTASFMAENVWVVNADGSGAEPLTKVTQAGADTVEPPAWSPDGSKLVFESSRALDGSNAQNNSDTQNIWVMNADGSGQTPLTKMTTVPPDKLFPAVRP